MKLSQKQVNELYFEEEIEVDGGELVAIEVGEFEQDHKYQSAELIFTDGEKYYRSYVTRSGSPFSDWYYEDYGFADIDEVEQRKVTVTRWVRV